MEENNQTFQVLPEEQNKKVFKILGIEAGIVLIIVVLVVLALYFSGVFSVKNKVEKNKTAIVPTVTQNQQVVIQASPTPLPPEIRKTLPFILCPVGFDICEKGQEVVEEVSGQKAYGVRFSNIPKNSSVLASLHGKRTLEGDTSFLIDNSERDIKVRYVIVGDFSLIDKANSSTVTENMVLGTFATEINSLTIYVSTSVSKQPIHLGIGKDGRYLTNIEK